VAAANGPLSCFLHVRPADPALRYRSYPALKVSFMMPAYPRELAHCSRAAQRELTTSGVGGEPLPVEGTNAKLVTAAY
jgi:hypothetical protein